MENPGRTLKVLITMAISQPQLKRLGDRVDIIQTGWGLTGRRLTEDELCTAIQPADVLLVGYEKITERVIQAAPNLKLIGVSRANPANIDLEAVNQKKILLLYTPGRNAIAAAEFTMGLILNQARNIGRSDRLLRSGNFLGAAVEDLFAENSIQDVIWDIDGDTPYLNQRGVELCGRTLGLIGFGNVASRLARLAQAFGMRVITHTPIRDETRTSKIGVSIVSLDKLLSESDFISIHCSVCDETKAILDATAFKIMKPGAFVINTARASMIDQAALMEALENGRIGGAALDVFWYEPLPANHPLLHFDNVTLTPHLAGSTHEVPERHSHMLVDDLMEWIEGRPPVNIFNNSAFEDCL